MKDWHDDREGAGMDNIIRVLKKPLHLDETFELRVMSAVHAEALARIDAGNRKHGEDHWWSRRYTLRFTALGGLAAAAAIAVVIALTATMSTRRVSAGQPTSSQHSAFSSSTVDFVFVNESAKQVYLVGDFNNWSKTRTPLKRTASRSAWTISIPLAEGKHEYAFIVADEDGEHWVADPLSTKVEDEFGTESSIVRVGPTSS
jgi:hypothetical protein